MWPSKDDSTNNGEVGTGSNWLEKSFPVDTDGEKMSATAVDDFNIGISGKDFQTGSLSKRMFDTIMSRQNDGNDMSDEIKEAYTLYAMDFTAKEATREALEQNGLDMILQEEEEDEGMWGDVEAVRLYDINNPDKPITPKKIYDSLEDAIVDWTPGQTFDFVVRQVPARIKKLSMDELVQALDPDGKMREEAKERRGDNDDDEEPDEDVENEALLSIFDDIKDLEEMNSDNTRRTEDAPRGSTDANDAYSGSDSSGGYRIINRSSLLRDSINQDGTENDKSM